MSTKQLLRGHRGRKARRFLKRHPGSYVEAAIPGWNGKLSVVVFGPPIWHDEPQSIDVGAGGDWAGVPAPSTAEMQPKFDAAAEVKRMYGLPEHACTVCGATGDNPCVTASGKRASRRHSGRDTL